MKSKQFCSVCKQWLDTEIVPTGDGEDDDGRGVGDAVHDPSGSVPSNPADGDDDDGEGQGDAFLDVGGRDSLLRPP